jgi:pimeloyl-ACP methyl ester carboxylesterase
VIDLHAFTGSPGSSRDLDALASALEGRGIRLIRTSAVPEKCAFVLGVSFGATAALETLSHHPKARALLVSPFLEWRTLSPVARVIFGSGLANLVIWPFRRRILRKHLTKASGGEAIPADLSRLVLGYSVGELVRSQCIKHRTPLEIDRILQTWKAVAPRASILSGSRDPLCRFPALHWQECATIEGAGHFLPWTRTEETVEAIVRFCHCNGGSPS